MPKPDLEALATAHNMLIHEELRYDRDALQEKHRHHLSNLNAEKRYVYETMMNAVDSNTGGLFFVYGYGGTGKTFIWRTLFAAIRGRGDSVLNVASSGIASLPFPGGRTAHSRFCIPIAINEDSTCCIQQGSELAQLIIASKFIIWDEAPMMQKYCFEALDRSLRDILRFDPACSPQKPIGGKTVVLGRDFRQILPVTPKDSRQDIFLATINSSYLWQHCKVLLLMKNMRLQNMDSTDEADDLRCFGAWIASIGDGTVGEIVDGVSKVCIPRDNLVDFLGDPIASIVHSTFPAFSTTSNDLSYLVGRSILAPTLDIVESVNDFMMSLNTCEGKTYLSSDTTCTSNSGVDILQNIHTPEFLNDIRCSGVPNHYLHLKVGTPIMLLQNIDYTRGMCNGTRLVVTNLGTHVVQAKILGGNNAGEIVLILRMSLSSSDPRLSFRFTRRQLPLVVLYAMTINKSQGQSLFGCRLAIEETCF